MRNKLLMLFLTAVIAIFTVACGAKGGSQTTAAESAKQPEELLTIVHKLGETKVKKNPQKVVVFDFGALDTLDKLGVEVTGVPKANLPSYLAKYKEDKYVNAGGIMEPDFERINDIKPDLIIISGRQQDKYEEFSKIGPTIFMGIDTTKYMESFAENAKTIGRIFDKETDVEAEMAKVNEEIKQLHDKAAASGKNALIILANDGKVSAYGAGSRFGIIHDVFGLEPVDKSIQVSTHGQSISFEYIVEKDPDYLFVVDRGAVVGGQSSAKSVVENELVKNTKAFKNNNVIYLDPNYWYLSGGGLISVSEMVKEVAAGLK